MNSISNKSRTSAFLLSAFLGTFGAHRFYAGKPGTAILMLILSISFIGLPISSIWALIDFIMICAGAFKDKEGLVIKNW